MLNTQMMIDNRHNGGPPLEPLVIKFTEPQYKLITSRARYPAMVAGFGAGKTQALVARAIATKFRWPECDIAYYLPTYDLVDRIAIPRFEEELHERGLIEGIHFKVLRGKSSLIKIFGCGEIIFRTMDRPGRIIGYEVGDSFVDELDTLKEEDARLAWQKIVARNRQKKNDGADNTIAVGTTPEGFRFVYQQWKKAPPSQEYKIIKASTYSNARNLPANYIDDLLALYPSNLIQAYLDGEFVNLTSGAVYPDFDRVLNGCDTMLQVNEPLHIGMDFNVGKMAAVVYVQRGSWPHAVAEITGLLDTPAMIKAIKNRFPSNNIFIYPDASGDSRKTSNASISDIALLKQAGFIVLVNANNPWVKDRVLSMNILISKRFLKVNCDMCPALAEGLEKQAYNDKGEPDKTSGVDHVIDAAGYMVCYRFPVLNSRIQKVRIGGI